MSESENKLHTLLFGVRRSVRYHSHRQRFFRNLNQLSNFLGLVLGSAAVVAFMSSQASSYGAYAAALAAVISAASLVFSFSERANQHENLKREFIEIEQSLAENDDEDNILSMEQKRLQIETQEPSKLYALDLLCHNEVVRAIYSREEVKDHIVKIRWRERMTANFVAWPQITPI
ncbi:MAG: hypothetical protein GKR96_11440 [Gammaproteobacteria bacterium]|nr:hypothetical protein [Gammaproteobacteria bacterium]